MRFVACLILLVACFLLGATTIIGPDVRTVGLVGLCASAAVFIVGIYYLFNSREALETIAPDDSDGW